MVHFLLVVQRIVLLLEAVDDCFETDGALLNNFRNYAPVHEFCDNIYFSQERSVSPISTAATTAQA